MRPISLDSSRHGTRDAGAGRAPSLAGPVPSPGELSCIDSQLRSGCFGGHHRGHARGASRTRRIDLTNVKMVGIVPVSIFAPVMIAQDKGYFAEEGLDVELVPFPGGSDPVVLTATGELDLSIAGAGPAFWNAVAQDLPITVIAPGHQEGIPVATPLMISRESCLSGEIASVADLEGKTVTVNAPGATEYWLNAALSTGGLTIDDVNVEALPFPDAVAALEAGAIDAAMIGEPLATQAEQNGIAVRLATDFPIEGIQPTADLRQQRLARKQSGTGRGICNRLHARRQRSFRQWLRRSNQSGHHRVLHRRACIPDCRRRCAGSMRPMASSMLMDCSLCRRSSGSATCSNTTKISILRRSSISSTYFLLWRSSIPTSRNPSRR